MIFDSLSIGTKLNNEHLHLSTDSTKSIGKEFKEKCFMEHPEFKT